MKMLFSISALILLTFTSQLHASKITPSDQILIEAEQEEQAEAALREKLKKDQEKIENDQRIIMGLKPERQEKVLRARADRLYEIIQELELEVAASGQGAMRTRLSPDERDQLLQEALEIVRGIPTPKLPKKHLRTLMIWAGATVALAGVAYFLHLHYVDLYTVMVEVKRNTDVNESQAKLMAAESNAAYFNALRMVVSAAGIGSAGVGSLMFVSDFNEHKRNLSNSPIWESFWNQLKMKSIIVEAPRAKRIEWLTDFLVQKFAPQTKLRIDATIKEAKKITRCKDLLTVPKPMSEAEIEAIMDEEFSIQESQSSAAKTR